MKKDNMTMIIGNVYISNSYKEDHPAMRITGAERWSIHAYEGSSGVFFSIGEGGEYSGIWGIQAISREIIMTIPENEAIAALKLALDSVILGALSRYGYILSRENYSKENGNYKKFPKVVYNYLRNKKNKESWGI